MASNFFLPETSKFKSPRLLFQSFNCIRSFSTSTFHRHFNSPQEDLVYPPQTCSSSGSPEKSDSFAQMRCRDPSWPPASAKHPIPGSHYTPIILTPNSFKWVGPRSPFTLLQALDIAYPDYYCTRSPTSIPSRDPSTFHATTRGFFLAYSTTMLILF